MRRVALIAAAAGSLALTSIAAPAPAEARGGFGPALAGGCESVLSCDLALNGTIDPDQVASGMVSLNGQPLQYGTDWKVVNGSTLELIGAACDTLKASPSPHVDATFTCGAVLF